MSQISNRLLPKPYSLFEILHVCVTWTHPSYMSLAQTLSTQRPAAPGPPEYFSASRLPTFPELLGCGTRGSGTRRQPASQRGCPKPAKTRQKSCLMPDEALLANNTCESLLHNSEAGVAHNMLGDLKTSRTGPPRIESLKPSSEFRCKWFSNQGSAGSLRLKLGVELLGSRKPVLFQRILEKSWGGLQFGPGRGGSRSQKIGTEPDTVAAGAIDKSPSSLQRCGWSSISNRPKARPQHTRAGMADLR